MPLERTMRTKRDKARESVTIQEIEELCIAARNQGAGDDALLKVDVRMEFASPTNVDLAAITW